LSLHALAASIERFRKEAGHNKPNLLLPDPTNAHN